MNSLATSSNAVHATSVTLTSAGYFDGELELAWTNATAPTANNPIYIWLLREIDGTNFEDGSASVTPTRNPDVVVAVRAVTTAQRAIVPIYDIPPGPIKTLVRNLSGTAFAASGNTVKLRPKTVQF